MLDQNVFATVGCGCFAKETDIHSKPLVSPKLNRFGDLSDVLKSIVDHRVAQTTHRSGYPKSPMPLANQMTKCRLKVSGLN